MRSRAPDYPSPVRNMRSVYSTGCGKRKRSDAKGVTLRSRAAPVEEVRSKLYKLKNQQKATQGKIISLYIIEERGTDAVGKRVQALLSQLQRVPKGAGHVLWPCIVRNVSPTRGRLSTFATAIRREE